MDSRQIIATKYKDMWGKKWFMITNPIYGRWEASIYNNVYPETEDDVMKVESELFKAFRSIMTFNFDNNMLTFYNKEGNLIIRAYNITN